VVTGPSHTASTTKGCRSALSTGPVRQLCFGSVKRMCLLAPLMSYLVARSSMSHTLLVVTQFLLSACCLIRNKITADPDGLFGTGQRPQVVMPMDHRLLSMLTDTHTCRAQCPPGLPIWCSQALFPFTHWHHVRCLCISTNSSD